MKFWLGVTDNRWFEFLSGTNSDEVNFWQPSGLAPFTGLEPGTPFLFKLKRPYNHIAGGGHFVKFARLPLSLAWEAFRQKNGAATYEDFAKLVLSLSSDRGAANPEIGCTILANPFFLPKNLWVEAPSDWSSNIVRGKTYDSESATGAKLLSDMQRHLQPPLTPEENSPGAKEDPATYGLPFLTRARLGQGAFRVLVTESYKRRCAITGENILPVLEAAHIKPFAKSGPNNVFNGLLLRSDFHKLFDLGYVTVTRDFRVEVSARIREEWFNGKAYYRLHGNPLTVVPEDTLDQPRQDLLEWHNENIFQG